MPLQQTSGNSTTDAYAGGVAVVPNYIEDVFSTWLYTGNGSTQTITNGIDLAGKGGMVWIKYLTIAYDHKLTDTVRGATKALISNKTDAQTTDTTGLTAFGSTGFTIGANTSYNTSNDAFASWTLRKQPKFFDIITWSGNNTDGRSIPHSLGSVPGCIIVKCTNFGSTDWFVWHRSIANNGLLLDTTAAASSTFWNPTDSPTSTNILVSNTYGTNTTGQTYVAYLFAHNAGGFGLTGTDNVISCGSFTTNGSGTASVTLGYEPQWLMFKCSTTSTYANWYMWDIMRGFSNNSGSSAALYANLTNAEATGYTTAPNATGFTVGGWTASQTYIYISIRRGPMKVPTDATKVFSPSVATGSGTAVTTGFPVDLNMGAVRGGSSSNFNFVDRLRGIPQTSSDTTSNYFLVSSATDAETISTPFSYQWWNTGYNIGSFGDTLFYSLRRAPGFFDEVCFTGDGTNGYTNHNLTVVPELIIYKSRSVAQDWFVWQPSSVYVGSINTSAAFVNNGALSPATATQFTKISDNISFTYVAYLFATCAGVSKVGSYTGTGATQTIACGFAAGARFVLVKRTDSTGDWYVWDSARGMVSGTDPSLLLNSTAAQVNANSVYAITTGFQIVSTAAGINASGGTYIFLAIA